MQRQTAFGMFVIEDGSEQSTLYTKLSVLVFVLYVFSSLCELLTKLKIHDLWHTH